MRLPLALSALLFAVPAAHAGQATNAVKFFYVPSDKFVADGAFRDRFTTPVTALFEKNDAVAKDTSAVPCLDFDPALDAQDFDQKTVKKTLKFSETVNGDTASVTATFALFPEGDDVQRQMVWSLRRVDGKWKIADIASKTTNWTLSQLECNPEPAGQDAN